MAAITLSPLASSAAATASLSFSPTNATVNQGSSVVLTIQVIAASQNISGAQACIHFDTSQLSLVNTDTSSSPLTYTTPSSSSDCAMGDTQVSRFGVSHPSGTFTLAKLTFKALAFGVSTPVAIEKAQSFIKDTSTTDSSGNYANILSTLSGSTIKQNAVAAGETSPNPSSPTGVSSASPALTDGTHSGQAASSDVKATNNSLQSDKKVIADTTTGKSTLYKILGLIAILVLTGILLSQFVGVPWRQTPIKKRSNNVEREHHD